MIRTFETKAKMLFTPKAWCNSVAKWILSLHSETGTIKISNTANPSDGHGPSLDIDAREAERKLEPILETKVPIVGKDKVIGTGVKWLGGKLTIDEDYIRNAINDALGSTTSPSSSGHSEACRE